MMLTNGARKVISGGFLLLDLSSTLRVAHLSDSFSPLSKWASIFARQEETLKIFEEHRKYFMTDFDLDQIAQTLGPIRVLLGAGRSSAQDSTKRVVTGSSA